MFKIHSKSVTKMEVETKLKKNHKFLSSLLPLSIIIIIAGIYLKSDTISYYYEKVHDLYRDGGSITDVKIFGNNNSNVVSFYSDSLRIVGDLYETGSKNPPCIILLHGSSTLGRKLPLIQVLASKFYNLGYTVLSIDMRGYGDSDDPPMLTEDNFRFADDVSSAIDFLKKNVSIDTGKIFVIGHSWGGSVALSAAFNDARIKKAVLFGPTRRLNERVVNENAPDREYFLERCEHDMQLNYDIEFPVWHKVINNVNIQNYVDRLGKTTPFYLIDASEEGEMDLAFLRKIYHQSKGNVAYYTIPNTNHYLDTSLILGEVFYNSKHIHDFVSHVNNWLLENE